MTNQYIIPDIHGCGRTLQYIIENIIKPTTFDHIYFLGDFINKGPDSRGVIDYILSLEEHGYRIGSVRGNHEQLLLDALEDPGKKPDFISKGGDATLRSFGAEEIMDIPSKYIKFINELPFTIELKNHIIVHAGLNFEAEDPFRDYDAMLNIREFPVIPSRIGRKKIIHGHNASTLDKILNAINNNNEAVNLDNGCVYTEKNGMGNMVVLNLNGWSFHIQPCIDKIQLP